MNDDDNFFAGRDPYLDPWPCLQIIHSISPGSLAREIPSYYIRVTYRLVKRKTLAQNDCRSVVYNLKPNALSHTPMLIWNIYAHLASIYGKCGYINVPYMEHLGYAKGSTKKRARLTRYWIDSV